MRKQCYYQNLKDQNLLKNKEASGILCSLGLKTPLNKIQLLYDILF